MPEPLATFASLALWSQQDLAEVEVDPWAAEVLREFSDYARFKGGHDGLAEGVEPWNIETAPYDVRRAVLMAAARTYKNPDSEVQTTVGPIGARVLDEAALAGAFTAAELEAIEAYHPDGAGAAGSGLYVVRIERGEPAAATERLYVSDNQQVNIDSTNAAPSWDIPMFSPGDPGGEV